MRVFASLNSPGTLAPLLALSLLCYLTVVQHRPLAIAGATVLVVALSLTFVRSAWVALDRRASPTWWPRAGQSARWCSGRWR